jgi:hypothetical protein
MIITTILVDFHYKQFSGLLIRLRWLNTEYGYKIDRIVLYDLSNKIT